MRRTLLILVIFFACALTGRAWAIDQKLPSTPAVLSADRVSYDEDLGLVVANGHVEISQQDRILIADTVTYNQRSDTVTASGNVSLLEPTGDVVFANFIELTGGLKDGVAQNFRLLLKDRSRFAAAGARREAGVLTEMAKGVFSPCELCKDDPEAPPLWQIKARRIVHDEIEHQVSYEDATLEMYGVPIAYSPYFSHPDPTVKRRSGFLTPAYGNSTQLGYIFEVPYFWAITDDKDLTIAPVFTTRVGQVLNGQYRQNWGYGQVNLAGSITDADALDSAGNHKKGSQLRGHFHGTGIFNIDDNWRTGFNAARESDDTYLRLYKVLYTPETAVLTSNAYVEGFFGRSYNALNAYAFQDTRASVKIRDIPIAAPLYDYNYVSDAGSHGQRWRVDANALNLIRPSGVNSHRLSQRTQWELPYTSPIGDSYLLTLSLETDGYSTENQTIAGTKQSTQSAGRVLPQGKFEWRYPWVRRDGTVQSLIEPRAAFIAGPQGRNSSLIPNEDSLDFEFDDQNLFSLNRFPGIDRVDGGERVVYGLSTGAYGNTGGKTTLFLGQSYRFHKDDTFSGTSGVQDNLSDVVGRFLVKPASYLDLTYRFRLSKKDLSPRRTEVGAHTNFLRFSIGADYLSTTQEVPGRGLTSIEQVSLNTSTRITDHWTFSTAGIRDLQDDQFRSLSAVATYQDSCFTLNVTASRSFAQDRDVRPSDTFLVQLIFKYLGQVNIGASNTTSTN